MKVITLVLTYWHFNLFTDSSILNSWFSVGSPVCLLIKSSFVCEHEMDSRWIQGFYGLNAMIDVENSVGGIKSVI